MEFLNKSWFRSLRRVAIVGNQVINGVIEYKAATGLGAVGVAIRSLDSLSKELAQTEYGYVFGKNWKPLYSEYRDSWSKVVHHTLLNGNKITNGFRDAEHCLAEINGLQLGFQLARSSGDVELVFIPRDQDVQKTNDTIAYFIWRSLGHHLLLADNDEGLTLTSDELDQSLPSQTADDIWNRVCKFNASGYKRSIMLHGNPGTGKSYIMRYISKKADNTSLRINIDGTKNSGFNVDFIKHLKPNTLLIDDFDRLERSSGGLLNKIEEFKKYTNLIIVSVNDISKLDPAIIRAGRFDEIIEVERLDAGVLNRLLCDVPAAVRGVLEELPVAYIEEYKRLLQVMGPEVADTELTRLVARARYIKNTYQKP